MNTADDETPGTNRQPDESDIGPEPDWLLDDDEPAPESEPADIPEPAPMANIAPQPIEAAPERVQPEPEAVEMKQEQDPRIVAASQTQPHDENLTAEFLPAPDAVAPPSQDAPVQRMRPWMWAAIPFVLLLATGIIAWFSGNQTLNGLTTWEALREQRPPLFPARWSMMMWWVVLPLLGVFLIYGLLPAGRAVTRIKVTGPLVSVALIATSLWIFAQHWDWKIVGLISIFVSLCAILAAYLLVALGPGITNVRQRLFSVLPLSAALAYGIMLATLSWQSYSSQPFGERGSSIVLVLLLVMAAAVFAFFLRDGLFSLVLAIWFAGVVNQQWGDETVITLVAIVAALLTAALAVLGTILATESHRPSLTTNVSSGNRRTSFFRKSEKPPEGELP